MSDRPGKLLVVDDNEMNRDMLSRRLGRSGYEITAAADGQAALEMIEQQSFDLILLDIMMPGINGMEVLRRVRQTHSPSDLPIIMATAKTESKGIVDALKLGANDYVTKPLDFPVVLARVNTQFQLKRATDDLRTAHARMKRDLEAAARIQQTLLPRQLPQTDRIRSAWAYRPCDELAGDSLNIFPMGDRHVGLYLLDVSGHGVPAALLSVAVTRSLSRQGDDSALLSDSDQAPEDISPAEIAAKLNALYPMESNGQHFFTMVYGILDTVSCELRFVCAGHSPPVLIRRDGQQQRLDATAMPIGVTEEAVYEDTRVQLQSGDRLYLYSDGLTEELNSADEQFGEERLQAAIAESQTVSLAESVDAMIQRAVSWRGDEHLKDDVSVLSIEIV